MDSSLPWQEDAPTYTAEQAALKRHIYDTMNPRRRTFIDRIGYDVWDPFQKPKEPMELRQDVTERTLQDLLREFYRSRKELSSPPADNAFQQGVLECAMGLVNKDERALGAFAFCTWYYNLLKKEGRINERHL